jgi:hypothetical protein
MRKVSCISGAIAAAALALGAANVQAQQSAMTFFVTSVNGGKGGDFGGLEGADTHCNTLAKAAGSHFTNWRAYLSTTKPGGDAGVNARDRIGKGPWHNVKGELIAKDVDDLHSAGNKITQQTALTEKAEMLPGSGQPGNVHDILTGSDPQGMYSTAGGDTTCGNWTKSTDGSAIVGHADRKGLGKTTRHMSSWNSAHGSRGCSPDQLKASGGGGLLYCFVAN